jgi:hypothetical protein
MSEPGARPGWYPDPSGTPQERWWNGMSWGEQTRPGSPAYAGPAYGGPAYGGPAYGGPVFVPPARHRSAAKVVLLIVGLLFAVGALFVGGIVWLALSLTGGPRDVTSEFFAALREGRTADAAGHLCARYADNPVDRLTTAFPDPVRGFDVDSVERVNDTATVTGDLTTGSASAYPLTLRLVREQDTWKICSLPG